MSALVIPALFCPPVSVWADWASKRALYLDINELYSKKSLRNRYFIAGANGIQMLSIPLQKGKHSGLPVKDVRIAYDEAWPRKHTQAIRSAYGKSPYFEYYFDGWMDIINHQFEYLYELNMQMMVFCAEQLRLTLSCSLLEERNNAGQTEKYRMNRPLIIPEISTIGRYYSQIWEYKYGYVHNLSIIDLLFCCGPESSIILNNINQSCKI